jgi:hypothetical protein
LILPKTIRDVIARRDPQPDPSCQICKGKGLVTEDTHMTDNGPGATRYVSERCQCAR